MPAKMGKTLCTLVIKRQSRLDGFKSNTNTIKVAS